MHHSPQPYHVKESWKNSWADTSIIAKNAFDGRFLAKIDASPQRWFNPGSNHVKIPRKNNFYSDSDEVRPWDVRWTGLNTSDFPFVQTCEPLLYFVNNLQIPLELSVLLCTE